MIGVDWTSILGGGALLVAALAVAHFGWRLLGRIFRGEGDAIDYATADIVSVGFLVACAAIAAAAIGLVWGALWLVGIV